MGGPKAPKDPVAKRCGFYIMRNKGVSGSVQPDGKGIQFLYLNGGRLLSSAKIVGNIDDEQMIEMLKTTEGFRKLVHSIGVTIVSEDKHQTIDFVLQMYGKQDTFKSGTEIMVPIVANGMENLINLEDYEWQEDDDVPGQIRFEFQKAGELATVDVKLYLQDGFFVPEPEKEEPVDVTSSDYRKMIEASLVQCGNNNRLKNAIEKAKRGEDVTIAFIGGSITQGAGAHPIHTESYAYKTYENFCRLFGNEKSEHIHLIKAGVGGTPSELGMIRYERDVMRDGSILPDIVVVEFAVNDAGDETGGECYDSLVRKILASPNKPAVVLLFAVFADDWNLQERFVPIGVAYQLPMVSIKDAVVNQFYKKAGEGKVLSKYQFFYDSYHPSNMGHKIMADSITYLFEEVEKQEIHEDFHQLRVEPIIGGEFQTVQLLDRKSNFEKAVIDQGSFGQTDENLQAVEMDKNFAPTKQFPYNWMHVEGNESFKMKITCSALVMVYKDSGEKEFGCARVLVDGKQVVEADPHINGWTHCNPVILFRNEELKEHFVEVQMLPGDETKKFTILGFGYVD